ncbi:TIGR03621 family F420-dependent LLM class oxidoreductase [Streptomyces malaysiensis]|uniref:TIGR03621 family F420-dependent LLM class oxidoreductase n=1 Tax=Streptomyces malaysiensis TaxID=92644 RepID=UPI001AD8E5B6|nr:TIGR03621 family F420-dependent LLM class oxidoreductase [Streptomyces malaysiensis]
MAAHRPFRFAAVVRQTDSAKAWAERARLLEDSGFSALLVPDHFIGPRFAPMPAMAAAAAATTTLRVGTLVLSNDYRHPVALAKEAATLDVLSDGRLDLGLGTGWLRQDYDRSGVAFDPPKVRFERFQEAVRILKGLWGEGPFSFQGEYYRLDELDQEPRPVQRPHPRLLFPGGGPRMLRFAAAEADSINFALQVKADGSGPDQRDGGLAAFLKKIAIVREAAGERFDRIELGTSVQQLGVGVKKEEWSYANTSQQSETPQVLVGGLDEIVEKLRYWRDEHGLSYFVLHNDKDLDAFIPVVAALAGT